MYMDRWMDKQKHIHNGILLSFKKECSSDTCYNMDEHWQHYTKWSQTQKDKYHMHLYEVLRKSKSWSWKVEWWLLGAERWGRWGVSLSRIQSFHLGWWRNCGQWMDSGMTAHNVNVLNATAYLKMLKWSFLCYVHLATIFSKKSDHIESTVRIPLYRYALFIQHLILLKWIQVIHLKLVHPLYGLIVDRLLTC